MINNEKIKSRIAGFTREIATMIRKNYGDRKEGAIFQVVTTPKVLLINTTQEDSNIDYAVAAGGNRDAIAYAILKKARSDYQFAKFMQGLIDAVSDDIDDIVSKNEEVKK